MSLIDSYSESNYDAFAYLKLNAYRALGQALPALANDWILTSAQFYLKDNYSPVGNVYAKVYATIGTPGTDGRPTGAALATSDPVDASTITGGYLRLVGFTFSGADQITLQAGQEYCICVEYWDDSGGWLSAGYDRSAPTHAGNTFWYYDPNGSWEIIYPDSDTIFYLYGSVPNDPPTAPTSLLCEGVANPSNVTDTTPEFSAVFQDPNSGDITGEAQIQVATDGGFNNIIWDSGWVGISSTTEGTRCPKITYASSGSASALSLDGQKYYWRIRFKDDDGAIGSWGS